MEKTDFIQEVPRDSEESEEISEKENEDSQDDWAGSKKKAKKMLIDPNSEMVDLPVKKEQHGIKKLSYKTVGGAQHKETYDPKTMFRKTSTSGLKVTSGFRNPASSKKTKGYYNHNLYNLSKGQQSTNQKVVSHSSPSWSGMRAGGKYKNSSLTSRTFNSKIESEEKKIRKNLKEKSV